jgi:hypothetical protein
VTISRTARPTAVIIIGLLSATIVHVIARAQNAAPRPVAPSLVRPTTPAKAPDADGFLRRWLILEPIPVSGQLNDSAVQSAVRTHDVPNQLAPNQLNTAPRDGETLTVGDTQLAWHAVDTVGYNVNLYHFAYALRKPTSNALFWVATVIVAPRDMSGVRLAIGSNAASIWWVNGTEVIGIYNERQTVIDDGVSKRLTLKKGPNVIRGAIVNAGGHTDFCARFLDSDDRPLTGITVSLADR